MRILDAMIMGLGLSGPEGEYVRSLHSGHGNQLRFSHYPPVPIDKLVEETLTRLPAHTDWRFVQQIGTGPRADSRWQYLYAPLPRQRGGS